MNEYAPEIEKIMKRFYDNLSEKDQRHYSAVEVLKLGHGGISYLSRVFGCARQTISKGLQELDNNELMPKNSIRRPGGGRKNYCRKHPSIKDDFLKGN